MQYDHFDPIKMSLNELRIQFVIMRADLKYRDEALRDARLQVVDLQNQPKKKTPVWKMILAFFTSLLFGVTSIMVNIGSSILTTKPPDPSGNLLLALAGIIFAICTFISTFIVGGSSL